ncbi:unnamed protein product [Allacma fusca]|uniref:Uncharacterized protein n=1 Tax=Allacma fusca TaxID=39272 RepID=A0A8J2KAB7_9HEXA|nr:unnamed protein product [Allacma fusca]
MTASRQPEANFIHRGANNYMSINNEEIINPCRPWKPLSGWIYSWSVNVLPVLLLVFAGVAVVTVIFFFLFGSKELISPRSYNNYSAERINVILGNKIDPCQDFGRSVCTRGGTGTAEVNQRLLSSTFDETARTVLHEIKLLLTDPSTSHKPKAIIMAKYLYNDCMHNSLYDSNDLEFLPFFTDDKPIIEWPITEEQWSQSEPSLERILALIFAHRGQSIFVVNLSEDDSSMFMLTLNLGVPVDLRNIGNQKIFAAVQALSNWKIDDPKTKMKKSVIIGEMREFENNFGKLFETVKCEVDELDIGEGNDGYYEEIALDYIHRQMSQNCLKQSHPSVCG